MAMFELLKTTAQELELCSNMQEKLEFFINQAETLPTIEKSNEILTNKVPGCTSDVYIKCSIKNDKLYCTGSSQALIIKGFLAIVLNTINEHTKTEVLNSFQTEIEQFLKQTKFSAALSPSRAHATASIISFVLKNIQKL